MINPKFCKFEFHSCRNIKASNCSICNDGSLFEFLQDAETYKPLLTIMERTINPYDSPHNFEQIKTATREMLWCRTCGITGIEKNDTTVIIDDGFTQEQIDTCES